MTHQSVGYIRVSSIDQNPDRQLCGIELDKVFMETISGSLQKRPVLESCIDYVREGDSLFVDSIDRLARNLADLQTTIKKIIDKGVILNFVKENLVFRTLNDPMANLTLHIMGAFAEFERSMIRSRQKEGIEMAKKAGKHMGRKPKITSTHKQKILDLKNNAVSIPSIAAQFGISRASVYAVLQAHRE